MISAASRCSGRAAWRARLERRLGGWCRWGHISRIVCKVASCLIKRSRCRSLLHAPQVFTVRSSGVVSASRPVLIEGGHRASTCVA